VTGPVFNQFHSFSRELESRTEEMSLEDCLMAFEKKGSSSGRSDACLLEQTWPITWIVSACSSLPVMATRHVSFACPVSEVFIFYLMRLENQQSLTFCLSSTSWWSYADFQKSSGNSCQLQKASLPLAIVFYLIMWALRFSLATV